MRKCGTCNRKKEKRWPLGCQLLCHSDNENTTAAGRGGAAKMPLNSDANFKEFSLFCSARILLKNTGLNFAMSRHNGPGK